MVPNETTKNNIAPKVILFRVLKHWEKETKEVYKKYFFCVTANDDWSS